MSNFPNEASFWHLLNSANMGSGFMSTSQFPRFYSQAPMTPKQQAFFESQQQAFLEFQQSQNRQQNQPQFKIPQQQSQSSNSLSQTESQPQRGRMKHALKKGKAPELIGDVTFRWKPEEETLLVKCFVAVFEDRNVGWSQPKDTLWFRVLNEFNRLNFQKRTKDMLSSKWSTLNHHCQKFNAIYKRCNRLKKSGENELDLMKRVWGIYWDENKNNVFNHEHAWEILRKHAKWNAPDPAPVDLTEDEHVSPVNIQELFGPDARPRPPGKTSSSRCKTKSDTSTSTGGTLAMADVDYNDWGMDLKEWERIEDGPPPPHLYADEFEEREYEEDERYEDIKAKDVFNKRDDTTRKLRTGHELFPGDICRPGKLAKRQNFIRRDTNSDRLF
ncbi:hypothetical protein Tco_0471348 [Tanacetum coccineum]